MHEMPSAIFTQASRCYIIFIIYYRLLQFSYIASIIGHTTYSYRQLGLYER